MRFLTLLLVPLLLLPTVAATGLTVDPPEGPYETELCHGRFNVCAVAPEPVRSVLLFVVRFACSQVSCPA